MRRFFLDQSLSPELIIRGEDAHHISRVLRMKPSDRILVVGNDGQAGVAELVSFCDSEITAVLCEPVEDYSEPPVKVSLAQCLPKSDKMDFIVQKAVELGVNTIYPIAAERSVVKYDSKKRLDRQDRWQKIAAEAAKQCRRNKIPQVAPVQCLQDLFATLGQNATIVMLYEGSTPLGIKAFLKECPTDHVVLLIGPEGGFSPAEVQMCQRHKVVGITMGPRIMRTETAAIAALSIVLYEKGDLGGG